MEKNELLIIATIFIKLVVSLLLLIVVANQKNTAIIMYGCYTSYMLVYSAINNSYIPIKNQIYTIIKQLLFCNYLNKLFLLYKHRKYLW